MTKNLTDTELDRLEELLTLIAAPAAVAIPRDSLIALLAEVREHRKGKPTFPDFPKPLTQ